MHILLSTTTSSSFSESFNRFKIWFDVVCEDPIHVCVFKIGIINYNIRVGATGRRILIAGRE